MSAGTGSPSSASRVGPMSEHKKGVVTNFIKLSLRGEPIVIYGDGNASRDFLYVDDLCDGIAAAVEADLHDEVLHLASGEETAINDLARMILGLTDAADTPIRHEERRRGEIERTFARPERAADLLGFQPAHSLAEGLEKTVRWFAERREPSRVG